MSGKDQARIIALQEQAKIARRALEAISRGCRDPEGRAEDALEVMNRTEWASRPNLVQGEKQ